MANHSRLMWDYRLSVRDPMSKSLSNTLAKLDAFATRLNLPNHVRERASILLRKALEYKLAKGRVIDHVILACIYRAILEDNLPISMKEVELLSNDKRRFRRRYRDLISRLGLKPITFNYNLYLNKGNQ